MAPRIPQYHESKEEIDRIMKRREIRQRLQSEYNRVNYNPFRLQNHVEILDPAVSRYTAMRASIYEHWKPSWQSFWKYGALAYLPIFVLSTYLHVRFRNRDIECRSGKVPYERREINRI